MNAPDGTRRHVAVGGFGLGPIIAIVVLIVAALAALGVLPGTLALAFWLVAALAAAILI